MTSVATKNSVAKRSDDIITPALTKGGKLKVLKENLKRIRTRENNFSDN